MGAYLPEWLFKSNLFDPICLSFSFWTGCICSGLSNRYAGDGDSLFNFESCYATSDELTRAVNRGLASICKRFGIAAVTAYYFRHSWATIAQNDCGASTEQVALCLNHASAHKVTSGYIRKKYTIVDEINNRVIRYVFQVRRLKHKNLMTVLRKREAL